MKSFLLFKYYQLLGRLARCYLAKRKPLIIGINGSVGKTSCRMIIDDILQANLGEQLTIYTSPKNFNGELGMSLSIFKITERTPSVSCMVITVRKILSLLKSTSPKPYDILILEYGIDRPLEMEFLCSIAKPHISVLTKLDAVHSLQFGTAEDIATEELKLQKNTLLRCYINSNDTHGMALVGKLGLKGKIYDTIGLSSTDYTIERNDKKYPNLTGAICSSSHITLGDNEFDFVTDSIGKIHHDYVALAYDIVEMIRKQYNLPIFDTKKVISLHLQAGRMSIFEGIHDSVIIDSSYNSSPLSLRKIIEESLILQKEIYPDRPCLYILGEMRELGESENQHHLELADYLMTKVQPHDQVILLGQAMRSTYDRLIHSPIHQFTNSLSHYLNRHDVAKKAKELITQNPKLTNSPYFIIVKGSQNTIFLEEVVKSLLADKKDISKLTRQGTFWEGRKR